MHCQRGEPDAAALAGWTVVLTRPVGKAAGWRRAFQAAGAEIRLLPGLAIRPVPVPVQRLAQWRASAADVIWIFTSPVAVEQAWALNRVWPKGRLMAVGQATAARLQALGSGPVTVPAGRQDSEGLLALPDLQQLGGRRIRLVTGVGGRGLLQTELRRRGAEVCELEVYARVAPRLDRRHFEGVRTLPHRSILLISSAEAMLHLQAGLPSPLWQRLLACPLVVSSPRLERLAEAAGFRIRCCARSALLPAMLAASEQIALRKGCL